MTTAAAIQESSQPKRRDPFVRQAIISISGIAIVAISLAGIFATIAIERQKADLREHIAAMRDSTMHARMDTAYALAVRLDSLALYQKAGLDSMGKNTKTILDKMAERSESNRQFQKSLFAEQRVLVRELTETLRREVRSVGGGVDSLQVVAPKQKK